MQPTVLLDRASSNPTSRAERIERGGTRRTRGGIAFGVIGFVAVLAGCSTQVLRPTIEVPSHFTASAESEAAPDVAWWDRFGDPVLSDLVRRAAAENRDVKIAAERVRAARAGVTVCRSSLWPNINGTAQSLDQHTHGAPDLDSSSGGIGVSWEIDLSGRLRAGAAAATADAVAAEDGRRGVVLLVLTDVASNYFTLVGALRQLDTVRAISAAQDETLRLVTARQRAGLASPFDVERARTAAASARAAIPPLETLAAASRHRIAVLIGSQAADAAMVKPWTGSATVPDIKP